MRRIAEFWIEDSCRKSGCKYIDRCVAINNKGEIHETGKVKPVLFTKATPFGRINIACETFEEK